MSDVTDPKPADDPRPAKAHLDAPSGIHLTRPLDEMSATSVAVVADAAAIIAQKKLAEASLKMAAAQAAMERLAAMKEGRPFAPKPVAPEPANSVDAKVTEAPKPVVEATPTITPGPAVEEKVLAAPRLVVEPGPAKPEEPAVAAELTTQPIPAERPVQQHESGIIRLAGALRKKAAAQAPVLPKPTGKRSLDPIANHSGLGRPALGKKRKIVTPGLIFLFALMTFYGLYASGNLPQFDRWTDSVVNDAHAHNDQVVGGILSAGRYILFGGAALIVLIAALLLKNYLHQKHNAEHERDFHTR